MRKTWRKISVSLCALTVAALALTGCSGKNGGGKTLKVGVRSDIINFSFLNETTGNYYGLEVDIANEMAKRMGYGNVEFTTVKPEDRKQTLLDGEVDCLVATYTISDTRLENFDFSPAYYKDQMKVMVEKSTLFTTLTDLQDKNVGVMSGANSGPLLAQMMEKLGMISQDTLEETEEAYNYEGATITKVPSYDELSVMLEEGVIDAACLDTSIAGTYMNDDRTFLDTVILEQEYGVATQKDSELSKEVSKTIQEMLDDGTIEQLIDKWN